MNRFNVFLAAAGLVLGLPPNASAKNSQRNESVFIVRIAPIGSFQRDGGKHVPGTGYGWFLGVESTPRPHLAVGLEAGGYDLRSSHNPTDTYSIETLDASSVLALSATSRLQAPGSTGLFLCSEVGPAVVHWGEQRSSDTLNPQLEVWGVQPSTTDLAVLASIGAGIRRGWQRPYPRLEASLQVARLFSRRWNATGLIAKTGLVF